MTQAPDAAPVDAAITGSDGPSTDEATLKPEATPERRKRPLWRWPSKADATLLRDAHYADRPPAETEADIDRPTEVVHLPLAPPLNPRRLRRERRTLVARRQEAVYHLGGLTFELFRRNLLTETVMCRRAEEVADIDRSMIAVDEELATLNEARRTRREARARQKQPTGYCLSCGSPYRGPANFCANCGSLVVRETPGEEPADRPANEVESPGGSGPTGVFAVVLPEEVPRT